MRGYVIRREDGKWYIGSGYAGPGIAVPYFDHRLEAAKVYRTIQGLVMAGRRSSWMGSSVKVRPWVVEVDGDGRAARVLGPLVLDSTGRDAGAEEGKRRAAGTAGTDPGGAGEDPEDEDLMEG